MAPKKRVSSTTLLNECVSEPLRFSYRTYDSKVDMVTLSGDELKAFFTNVIQPAQLDTSNKIWNLKYMFNRRYNQKYDPSYISEWYLTNNDIEVYFQDIGYQLEKDLSPNARAVYKMTKQGVTTNGIYIRRSFQNKIIRQSSKNTNTLLELSIDNYQLKWIINGPNYKLIMNKHDDDLEVLEDYLKINELSEDLKWFQCGLTWLKKWFHLQPPTVDTKKRILQAPISMVKFDAVHYYYPQRQPDTMSSLNGFYNYVHPVYLSVKKDPLYKELESFGINMRKLIAKNISDDDTQ